uniref:Uncharacterized protein n=1 Tax=Lophocladia kuetzingii TaxID=675577 RepID=A0A1Z1MPJ5_9FLOR|nr:hypothetical protein [Lophocladia kuetzingii]ARW67691.1 hypothetical protein [Lophocladia kuetzingii]
MINHYNKIFTQDFFIPGAQVNYDIVFPAKKKVETNEKYPEK